MFTDPRKVFISHASEDKERFVLKFAEKLRENGVDAWVDAWEMLPGDSIVDKIFEEGIKNSYAMIIILSNNSVQKKWVREELNSGFINRICGKCKLIPVVLDECDIPEALHSTIWQEIKDLDNYELEFQRILNAIFERNSRPPLGPPTAILQRQYIRDFLTNIRGKLAPEDFPYEISDLEGLILDKFEAPILRLEGLQLYLALDTISIKLIKELINDPDFNIRRIILRFVHDKATQDLLNLIDKQTLENLFREPEDEVAAIIIRLAGILVEKGLIPLEILTLVKNHRYFLVKKVAIEQIIKANKPESLNLLYEFKAVDYHVSQRLIREYINQHFVEFDSLKKREAISLVEELNKVSSISDKTRDNNVKLIEKLEMNFS
jgi:hypothetical protein